MFEWEAKAEGEANGFTCAAAVGETLVAGAYGAILTSGDGERWARARIPEGVGWLRGAFASEDGFACVVGDGGTLLVSQDGAATFESHGTDRNRLEGVARRGDQVWVVGAAGTILHSGDRGRSWSPQRNGSGQHLSGIVLTPNGTLYVSGTGGTVLRSVDGQTWTIARQKGSAFLYGIASLGGALVAPAGNGSVYVSHDDGGTWKAARTRTKGYFYGGAAASGREVWVAGSSAERQYLLLSSEDGKVWHPHALPESGYQLDRVFARSDDEIWVAGGERMFRGIRVSE